MTDPNATAEIQQLQRRYAAHVKRMRSRHIAIMCGGAISAFGCVLCICIPFFLAAIFSAWCWLQTNENLVPRESRHDLKLVNKVKEIFKG